MKMKGEWNYEGVRWIHYTFLFGYLSFWFINLLFFPESANLSTFLWATGVLVVSGVWATFSSIFVYKHNLHLIDEKYKLKLKKIIKR